MSISRFSATLSLSLLFVSSILCFGQNYPWINVKPGKYKVGFTANVHRESNGDSSLICIWYPSNKTGKTPMQIRDFILKERINNTNDTTDLVELKQFVERIYGSSIGQSYFSFLKTKTNTYFRNEMAVGKFPY
jgi:hypothetical protein